MKQTHYTLLLAFFLQQLVIALPMPSLAAQAGTALDLPDFELYQSPRPAEDIPMLASDGAVFHLSDLKGHVVLLNFWRRNCPYCVQEKAFLKQVSQSIGSPDLKIVCANFWDSPNWVKSYGQTIGGEILVAAKPPAIQSVIENVVKGQILGYFVLNEAREAVYEVRGFPSTYIIDRRGLVVASHVGMAKWSSGAVERWLQTLLAGNEGKEFPDGGDTLERLMRIGPRPSVTPKDLSPVSGQQRTR